MKKILSLVVCFIMLFTTLVFPISANDSMITPYWSNTRRVWISHEYVNGKSNYQVEINGYSGTTLIDNVDLKLYRIVDDDLMVLEGWVFDLSQTGQTFEYSGTFNNVLTGYVYRLIVTADVHRNGTVESIDCYGDVQY